MERKQGNKEKELFLGFVNGYIITSASINNVTFNFFKENIVGVVEITQLLKTHTECTLTVHNYMSLTMVMRERGREIILGIKKPLERKTFTVKTVRH